MLTISNPPKEIYNEDTNTIKVVHAYKYDLEHSLISVSKWEAKYKKPFLKKDYKMDREETDYYIKCMCIGKTITDEELECLTIENRKLIKNYIHDPMTATTFTEKDKKPKKSPQKESSFTTTEYIYYSMFANQIPIKCETWPLNRLLVLLEIFSIKNDPDYAKKNKMSKSEIYSQNRALNEARRKKYNSRG